MLVLQHGFLHRTSFFKLVAAVKANIVSCKLNNDEYDNINDLFDEIEYEKK